MSDIYFSTRLNSFALGKGRKHPEKAMDTIALIEIAATVKGLNALEINYPEHFLSRSVAEIATALDKANLVVKGVQLRWPAPKFADTEEAPPAFPCPEVPAPPGLDVPPCAPPPPPEPPLKAV